MYFCVLSNVTGNIARGSFLSGEYVGFKSCHHSTATASTKGTEVMQTQEQQEMASSCGSDGFV